jgi:predicted metal-dependent hydrolase
MMLSNEELFAKAHAALWIYQQGLEVPLSIEEQAEFIQDFIKLELQNAAKFRL